MAVLDASTANSSDSRLIQRHTMALVNMSAHLISRWNFLNEYGESWILRFHSRPEFVGLLHEALMAIDDNGNILAVNESALVQLGCSNRRSLVGEPIGRFFQFNFCALEQRAQVRAERDLAGARRGARPPILRDRAGAAAQLADAAASFAAGRSGASRGDRRARARARRRGRADAQEPRLRAPAVREAGADPAARRDRHGQGGIRQVPASQRAMVGQAVRDGQLRRHSRKPDRERAVRLHARRVHRSGEGGARRQDPAIERRHAVPGRDRRHAAHAADPAAAGHRGARGGAARQRSGDSGQPARDQRHAPRRPSDDPGGAVPRGSVLPAERHHAASAAAARSRRQGGVDPHAPARGERRTGLRSGSTRMLSPS